MACRAASLTRSLLLRRSAAPPLASRGARCSRLLSTAAPPPPSVPGPQLPPASDDGCVSIWSSCTNGEVAPRRPARPARAAAPLHAAAVFPRQVAPAVAKAVGQLGRALRGAARKVLRRRPPPPAPAPEPPRSLVWSYLTA